jgi:hypothetical protein
MGQMEGDAVEGSPHVMVLGDRSTSVPLTPSIARGVSQWGWHDERGQWCLEMMGSHL